VTTATETDRGPVIHLSGEVLTPLAEGALHWPAEQTVFIADPHFGKAATFRAAGVALPGGTTGSNLARLDTVFDRTGAQRLVILGDLFHAAAGKRGRTVARMTAWRESRAGLEILVVRGNHDRSAGDPPAGLGMEMRSEPHPLHPFVLRHHPQPSADGYVLAGHIHPAVRLRGRGRQRARLPCFWFGETVGVLPAFGDFTGAAVVEPAPGDRVFVLAGGEVVQV
jgi:uncharacterized protein